MMFDKLAEELKQARIKNKLSVQQLSSLTRIDARFIEAMESGDFSFLPEVYVKAFTKNYAKAVELDENVIIKKYEAFKKGLSYEEEEFVPHSGKKPIELAKDEKKESSATSATPNVYNAVKSPITNPRDLPGKKRLILSSVLVGLIAIFAVIYFFFLRSSNEIIVPEKPIEEVIKENKQRFVQNEKPDSTINKVASSDSLNLTIISNDTSWIKIIVDDKKVDDFILFPHSQKDVVAGDNYKITFGNSGGIVLGLNNKPLKFEGSKGKVKYVLINKHGLEYLSNPPAL